MVKVGTKRKWRTNEAGQRQHNAAVTLTRPGQTMVSRCAPFSCQPL